MKALVTGAARGLGRALTNQLLADGYEVWAVDRDTDPIEDLAVSSRGACTLRLADMANPDSIERMLRSLEGVTFDLVILNAGISATGKFEDIPAAAYTRLIDVNLRAPLTLASALVQRGNMGKKSKIVFISSLSHAVGYPGAAVYAATKDGLAIYARSVRKPFKKRGVSLLTVFPGPIRTEHAAKHAPKGAKENKRMEPQKLAGMILKAARGRAREFYPGTAASMAKTLGRMFPNFATRMMRKAIYDKLDDVSY